MLNFSRQAHNAKVTDCHALFRILRFFELGCFLGRNIDLGGSFPTHDLKFGQFCDSKKNREAPKWVKEPGNGLKSIRGSWEDHLGSISGVIDPFRDL